MIKKPEIRRRSTVRAAITGVHGYLPDYVLSNAELATLVDTTDTWIVERTGIKERRILKGEGLGTSHMASAAVKGLLEKTATRPADVDLLICATTTPDLVFPSTANLVCDMVGIRNIGSFDVQAACSGFLYALTIAVQFISTGQARKVIVVGADKMSAIIDYTDRATCVLFGDGAGAVMVERAPGRHGIVDTIIRSDGAGMPFLHQKAGGSRLPPTAETVARRLHHVHQEGAAVYKIAVAKMAEVASDLLKRNRLSADKIDWLVPHQANRRIIDATAERMGMPLDRVMITIHKYGNTTAATIPLCLWDYESRLKPGDKLIMAAFGGGFTWAGAYVTWCYKRDP
jgi:3-oxoacyl-[acyl-carrier-protein] synthase-3